MRFAILLNNRVIDIVESTTLPDYPPTSEGYIPKNQPCDENVVLGMYYHPDTQLFSFDEPKTTRLYTQTDRIEESQLVIMEAIADQYEQGLANRLDDQEVQATIFETILELGGNV